MQCRIATLTLTVLCVATTLATAEEQPGTPLLAAAAKTLPAHLDNDRPLLFLPKLAAPKALNGDLKDPVWANAASFQMVSLDNEKIVPARLKTEARLFCTDDALYFGINSEDPDSAHCTVNNGEPWQNDSIECFLYAGESSAGGKLYYQIAIDVDKHMRTIHAHMYPRHNWRRLEVPWNPGLDCEVVKSDAGWTMEFKVKFSDLDLTPEARAKNSLWRLHLVRNRPARGQLAEQTYAWMPTDKTKQNHLPWRWGYIIPETYASADLLATVAARGKELDDSAPPSADVIANVRDQVSRFGSEDFSVRDNATKNVIAMVQRKRPVAIAVQDLLKNTIGETQDSEVKFRSLEIIRACRQSLDPDDDPLPPELNFEGF